MTFYDSQVGSIDQSTTDIFIILRPRIVTEWVEPLRALGSIQLLKRLENDRFTSFVRSDQNCFTILNLKLPSVDY